MYCRNVMVYLNLFDVEIGRIYFPLHICTSLHAEYSLRQFLNSPIPHGNGPIYPHFLQRPVEKLEVEQNAFIFGIADLAMMMWGKMMYL